MAKRTREGGSGEPQPNAAEVRQELERVLGSALFTQAGRASEFLRFVVEETLEGRSDRLKGYAIAVAVFGKPPDFDAQSDPLVRVEAGRLRRRLIEYYHAEGRHNPVRIALPSGGYTPAFSAVAEAPAPAATPPRRERRVLLWASLVAAIIVAAAALFLLPATVYDRQAAIETPVPTAAAPSQVRSVRALGPRMLVMPFANLSGNSSLDNLAAGVTEETIRALVSYNIFATASAAGTRLESTELAALRSAFDVGYVLTGNVRSDADSLRISVRLLDTDVGTQLWTRVFDQQLEGGGAFDIQENVGATIARIVSSPFGPVYAHEISRTAARPVEDLDPYECLLRFYEYARFFDAAGHAECVRCMERAVLSEPRFAPGWSALGVLYLHEQLFGYTPQPDRPPALERAREAVRTSLDIDGTGRIAMVTLAAIRLASGDEPAFEESVDRMLASASPHPATSLTTGYLLTQAGDWQRGALLLDESMPLTANVPGWANVAYAFRYLQTGEYDQALEWSLKSDAPNWFITPLTVAASAALAGRLDLAQRSRERLLELYPDFETTGRERLTYWHLDAALLARLLEGLHLAGLEIA